MAKEKKEKPHQRASRVKEVVKRGGANVARKMRERRTKGLAVSLATAAVAGWYEAGKSDADLALFNQSGKSAKETEKAITKVDAVGLAAGAIALYSGNGYAYDVALGLLPCMVRHQIRTRAADYMAEAGLSRPPPAKNVGAIEDDSMAGAVPIDSLMGDSELDNMAGYDDELGAAVEVVEGY